MLEDLRRVLRMDSPAPRLSESNIRKLSRGLRSSKKSRLSVQSVVETHSVQDESICNRSVSLSNLHPANSPNGMAPRVDKLQSLEAKMASIEMSLGWRRRREALLETLPRAARDLVRELDSLHQSVKDKDVTIQSLRSQITKSGGESENGNVCENGGLSDTDKQKIHDRLTKIQTEMDAKKVAVKNLTLTLDKIDITDNIDVRIRAAELEYELEREELNIINLKEELTFLSEKLQENASSSLLVNGSLNKNLLFVSDLLFPSGIQSPSLGLHVFDISVSYTPGNPPFHVTSKHLMGCVIDWATDDSRLKKGDRIIEMNGEIVKENSLVNVTKFMSSSSVLSVVIARSLGKSESVLNTKKLEKQLEDKLQENKDLVSRLDKALRERDYQKNENTRLNHRISYLEDQVGELQRTLESHEESSLKSDHGTPTPPGPTIIQVYQRGPETISVSKSNKCLSDERLNGIGNGCTDTRLNLLPKRSESYDGLNEVNECVSDNTSILSGSEPKHEEKSKREPQLSNKHYNETKDIIRNSPLMEYIQKSKTRSANFLFHMKKSAKGELMSTNGNLFDECSETASEFAIYRRSPIPKERSRESKVVLSNKQRDYLVQKSYKRPLFHQTDNTKYVDRRPVPPKKPERLSLQRTISLQSVEDVRPPSRISTHSTSTQGYIKSPHKEPIYGEIFRNSGNIYRRDKKAGRSQKYNTNGHPMPPPRTSTANLPRKISRISEALKEDIYDRNTLHKDSDNSIYDNYRRPKSPDASFHLDNSTDEYSSKSAQEYVINKHYHRESGSYSPLYAEQMTKNEHNFSDGSFVSGPPTPHTPPRGLIFTTPPRQNNDAEWC